MSDQKYYMLTRYYHLGDEAREEVVERVRTKATAIGYSRWLSQQDGTDYEVWKVQLGSGRQYVGTAIDGRFYRNTRAAADAAFAKEHNHGN